MTTLTYKYDLPPGLRHLTPKPDGPLYPLIRIRLYNKDGVTRTLEGLLDSGADTLFFPLWLAEDLGLPKIEIIQTSGVLKRGDCYKTEVGFTIGSSNKNKVDFGFVEAAFPTEENDIPILIGREPLFKYFEITFQEYKGKPKIILEQKKDF